MSELSNLKHEAFARAIANGESAAAAYRAAVNPNGTAGSARVAACQLRKRPDIAERIAELHQANSQVVAEKANFTRDQGVAFLIEIIETPVGQITAQSRLAHKVTRYIQKTGGKKGKNGLTPEVIRETLEMPNKLDAFRQLCLMCGWIKADTEDDQVPGLMSLLRRLRRPGIPQERRQRT